MSNPKIVRTKGGRKRHPRAAVSASERGEAFSGGGNHDRIFNFEETVPAKKIIWSTLRHYIRDQGWSQTDDIFEESRP